MKNIIISLYSSLAITLLVVRLNLMHLLPQDVRIDKQLQSGLRVTVQLNKTQNQGEH